FRSHPAPQPSRSPSRSTASRCASSTRPPAPARPSRISKTRSTRTCCVPSATSPEPPNGCQRPLPPDPTEEELRSQRIVPDTTIRDILKIDSVAPDQPGPADLLERVYRRRSIGPVVVTMSEWAAYPPPEGSTFHSEPPMPIKYGGATRF